MIAIAIGFTLIFVVMCGMAIYAIIELINKREKKVRIKITMADGKEIVGERELMDTFMDGWSNTLIHNYKKYSPEGAEIGSGKKIKLSNKWIVSEEGVN